MAGPLEGKFALVTGASGGIGAAAAIRLAEMGATVVAHGRNLARTEAAAAAVRSIGGSAHVVTGGLSTEEDAAGVIEGVRAAVGGIDILVNNAGGDSAGGGTAGWFDVTPAQWMETYDSNVGSMVRLTRAFTPDMKDRGWGRIILLSSAVVDHPMEILPDYQAAKAAIRGMARSLMKTLARTGITVNSISPGFILTDTNSVWIRTMAERSGVDPSDWAAVESWAKRKLVPVASDRLGRPDDIATVIAFLAHPDQSFLNGIDIRVDGGS
jgi:3-oxoacyl-[acyl-carrier protein] reductase